MHSQFFGVFPQEKETEHMIEIGVGQEDIPDRAVPLARSVRLQGRERFNLRAQIGRRVDEQPGITRGADCDTRLSARWNLARARGDAVSAAAIPLWDASAGGASQKSNANRLLPRGWLLDRPRVTRALKENRHVFNGGFDPELLFNLFHKGCWFGSHHHAIPCIPQADFALD